MNEAGRFNNTSSVIAEDNVGTLGSESKTLRAIHTAHPVLTPARRIREPAIDIIRAISILFVVSFHLHIGATSFGFLGVDVFFVVSGYLMYLLHGLIESGEDVKLFYLRRSWRILPAYFLIILICLIIAEPIVLPDDYRELTKEAAWSAVLLSNFDFLFQYTYFASHVFRPLLHLWSLGVECQFYIIFPLLLYFSNRTKLFIPVACFVSFLLFLYTQLHSPKVAFYLLPCRLWQFLLGWFAAKVRLMPSRRAFWLALASLVIVIVSADIIQMSFILATITSSCIAAVCMWSSRNSEASDMFVERGLAAIGRYSYSIYLTHYPIIVFLSYLPFGVSVDNITSIQTRALAVILISLASILVFQLVEKPTNHPRNLKTSAVLFSFAVFACVAVAIVGATQLGRNFNRREALVAAVSRDTLPERCPKLGRLMAPFDKSCVIAGRGANVVLLVGDSHADVLKEILGKALANRGSTLRLMINHSAVYRRADPRLAREDKLLHVDEAAIHWLSPEEILEECLYGNCHMILLHSRKDHIDVAAIEDLVVLAEQKKIIVSLIMPVPNPGFNVPFYLYSMAKSDKNTSHVEVITNVNKLSDDDMMELKKYAIEHRNFYLFDPQTFLCNSECLISDADGRPYYSDGQHLTQTGVRVLSPLLSQVARQVELR